MSDLPVFIACVAICIAILSVAMSWNALQHSATVWRGHQRLHGEFWRQSLAQADQNCKVRRSQVATAEHLAFVLNHLSLTPPPSDKPPDVPLN